jgi:hypothetical protein
MSLAGTVRTLPHYPHAMTSTPSIQATQGDMNITPVSQNTKKPVPKLSKLGLVGQYSPSPDGVDENLLILFHGFGECDSNEGFIVHSLKEAGYILCCDKRRMHLSLLHQFLT